MTKRRRVLRSEGEIDFNKRVAQEDFARLAGISQQEVSQLLRYSVLSPDGTAGEWTKLYFRFLQGQVFARKGWRGLE
jgi:hypothetical protein